MKQTSIITTASTLMLICVMAVLAACSSGDDAGTSTTIVSGTVVAAPVSGASVVVKDAAGNVLAGPVTTAGDGSYSIDPGSAFSGTFIIESSGGSYTDEATGQTTTAAMLTAYVDGTGLAAGAQVQVTAASTIVHDMVVDHGMTLGAALAVFKDVFGFDANSTVAPADAADPAADASDEELLVGLRMAAFSQLTMDLGLSAEQQFELLAALAEDLADGSCDGAGVTGPIAMLPADIHSRFSQAMVAFHNSSNNQTGLANDMIGAIPFARVALTNTYRVEYNPGMMAAMEGKTTFQLHITAKDTGVAQTGLTVTLMPMMHMAEHMHSTPKLDCSDAGAGDYDCTVYYLMASSMATGMSMGYWELGVMAGMGESATFYPEVKMAMADTAMTKLKGQSDVIKNMLGEDEQRSYILFNDGLTGSGPYTFTLFIAARESMMSFPAVINNTQLASGMGGTPLDITSIMVDISVNGTPVAYAADNGDGTWTVNMPLNDGVANQVEVKLSVNGEWKTSNGAADGLNATFMITPGVMTPGM